MVYNDARREESIMDVSEREKELITYYRALTIFNQQRVFTIARNSYEDRQRTMKVRENIEQAKARARA